MPISRKVKKSKKGGAQAQPSNSPYYLQVNDTVENHWIFDLTLQFNSTQPSTDPSTHPTVRRHIFKLYIIGDHNLDYIQNEILQSFLKFFIDQNILNDKGVLINTEELLVEFLQKNVHIATEFLIGLLGTKIVGDGAALSSNSFPISALITNVGGANPLTQQLRASVFKKIRDDSDREVSHLVYGQNCGFMNRDLSSFGIHNLFPIVVAEIIKGFDKYYNVVHAEKGSKLSKNKYRWMPEYGGLYKDSLDCFSKLLSSNDDQELCKEAIKLYKDAKTGNIWNIKVETPEYGSSVRKITFTYTPPPSIPNPRPYSPIVLELSDMSNFTSIFDSAKSFVECMVSDLSLQHYKGFVSGTDPPLTHFCDGLVKNLKDKLLTVTREQAWVGGMFQYIIDPNGLIHKYSYGSLVAQCVTTGHDGVTGKSITRLSPNLNEISKIGRKTYSETIRYPFSKYSPLCAMLIVTEGSIDTTGGRKLVLACKICTSSEYNSQTGSDAKMCGESQGVQRLEPILDCFFEGNPHRINGISSTESIIQTMEHGSTTINRDTPGVVGNTADSGGSAVILPDGTSVIVPLNHDLSLPVITDSEPEPNRNNSKETPKTRTIVINGESHVFVISKSFKVNKSNVAEDLDAFFEYGVIPLMQQYHLRDDCKVIIERKINDCELRLCGGQLPSQRFVHFNPSESPISEITYVKKGIIYKLAGSQKEYLRDLAILLQEISTDHSMKDAEIQMHPTLLNILRTNKDDLKTQIKLSFPQDEPEPGKPKPSKQPQISQRVFNWLSDKAKVTLPTVYECDRFNQSAISSDKEEQFTLLSKEALTQQMSKITEEIQAMQLKRVQLLLTYIDNTNLQNAFEIIQGEFPKIIHINQLNDLSTFMQVAQKFNFDYQEINERVLIASLTGLRNSKCRNNSGALLKGTNLVEHFKKAEYTLLEDVQYICQQIEQILENTLASSIIEEIDQQMQIIANGTEFGKVKNACDELERIIREELLPKLNKKQLKEPNIQRVKFLCTNIKSSIDLFLSSKFPSIGSSSSRPSVSTQLGAAENRSEFEFSSTPQESQNNSAGEERRMKRAKEGKDPLPENMPTTRPEAKRLREARVKYRQQSQGFGEMVGSQLGLKNMQGNLEARSFKGLMNEGASHVASPMVNTKSKKQKRDISYGTFRRIIKSKKFFERFLSSSDREYPNTFKTKDLVKIFKILRKTLKHDNKKEEERIIRNFFINANTHTLKPNGSVKARSDMRLDPIELQNSKQIPPITIDTNNDDRENDNVNNNTNNSNTESGNESKPNSGSQGKGRKKTGNNLYGPDKKHKPESESQPESNKVQDGKKRKTQHKKE